MSPCAHAGDPIATHTAGRRPPVTEAVVHRLEVVEVEEETQRLPSRRARPGRDRSSWNGARLASPVRGSWKAWWRQLLLEVLALLDVADREHEPLDRRVGEPIVGDRLQVAPIAAGVAEAGAQPHHARPLDGGGEQAPDLGPVFGVHQVDQLPAEEPLGVVSEQLRNRRRLPADASGPDPAP